MNYNAMFSPVKIGGVTVPNRFVVPPMGNNFANGDGSLSDRSRAYYEERAKGGFGLITIEATVIDATAKGGAKKPCLFSDDTIDSFRAVADACHRHGAKVSVQLQHAGPEGNPSLTGHALKAASPIPSSVNKAIPREITKAELSRLVQCYGDAAKRAKKAGIDMVELHCAHGYLLHSFLSPRTNQRTDEYGGCLKNRLRLIREILENIRKKAGADFPVLCRINACDDVPGGLTVQDSAVIAAELEELGVDGLHVSRAVHLRDDKMWATAMTHSGFSSDLITEIKGAVKIPVIAVGRFTDPSYGELLVRQGRADLIAFGRQSIADPHLPQKARTGKMDTWFPCVGCLQGCVPNMFAGQPITCLSNPSVGREALAQKKSETKKKIMVIGGGVGGLTAARVCAVRGHDVTLFESQPTLGGQMKAAAVPPGKGDMAVLLRACIASCENSGVKIRCNTTVTPSMLSAEDPDVILLATGAVPVVPNVPGITQVNCVKAADLLTGKAVCGKRVLILGGGMVGCETASFLGERHFAVTILEQKSELGAGLRPEHARELKKLFREYEINTITDATVRQFTHDGAIYTTKSGEDKALTGFDTIVLAVGAKSRTDLLEAARRSGKAYYVIGDAAMPRSALEAIGEGYQIAEKL
ncbi:MAG: FAD-dependent oxidoreductase [Oscillospiraceae bacterium]|nr:FAD-dependent oxidoreductase [Oscillospiraceae bacterium]